MACSINGYALPCSDSSDLVLSHPTPQECCSIWKLSYLEWGDALTLPEYLEESEFLSSVPLAENGGMTLWILVDRYLPPDHRPILCSCETFRKKCFVARDSVLSKNIIHGVASVFCNPAYRRRGYASRLMSELAKILPSWQTTTEEYVGSVLYSDIGKKFYARLGWHPFSNNNMHVELDPRPETTADEARALQAEDLGKLCEEDQDRVRGRMASGSRQGEVQMMLVPDHDHMLWHHKKEEFVCDRLFGKRPTVRGAVAGAPGNRIWAIWTHRFYGDPKLASSGNTLYILRLVLEDQEALNDVTSDGRQSSISTKRSGTQTDILSAVLHRAQAEAAEWNLGRVILWHPTRLVCNLIQLSGLQYRLIERENEGIASLLWYGKGSGKEDTLDWIGNEKFAWC